MATEQLESSGSCSVVAASSHSSSSAANCEADVSCSSAASVTSPNPEEFDEIADPSPENTIQKKGLSFADLLKQNLSAQHTASSSFTSLPGSIPVMSIPANLGPTKADQQKHRRSVLNGSTGKNSKSTAVTNTHKVTRNGLMSATVKAGSRKQSQQCVQTTQDGSIDLKPKPDKDSEQQGSVEKSSCLNNHATFQIDAIPTPAPPPAVNIWQVRMQKHTSSSSVDGESVTESLPSITGMN
jgi:hypothetical protein